jgi:hypothetical protein
MNIANNLDNVRDLLQNDPTFILIDDESSEFPQMMIHFEQNPTDTEGFINKWGKTSARIYKDLGLEIPKKHPAATS